jgi:hypothetical protein
MVTENGVMTSRFRTNLQFKLFRLRTIWRLSKHIKQCNWNQPLDVADSNWSKIVLSFMPFLIRIKVLGSTNSQAVCQVLCCWNKHYVGGWTMEWKERRMKEDFAKTSR